MRRASIDSYLTLAQRINAAALDPAAWNEVLIQMSVMVDGVRAHLLSVDLKSDGEGIRRFSHGYDPEYSLLYNAHYAAANPWVPVIKSAPVGTMMTAHQMYPTDLLRRSEFYGGWVRPQEDIIAGGGGALMRNAHRMAVIGGNIRARDADKHEDAWIQLLTDVTPLLQQALEVNRRLADHALWERLHKRTIDPGGAAVILLGPDRRIVSLDARAAEMVEAGALLRLDALGKVSVADAAVQTRIERISSSGPGEPLTGPISLPLRGQNSMWQCHLIALGDDDALAQVLAHTHFVAPPLLVMVLSPIAAGAANGNDPPFGVAHGLSPAETAVAGLLADGLTPREIAEARGSALVTVRNQIKQAMLKTHSNRQVDLVRLVLAARRP